MGCGGCGNSTPMRVTRVPKTTPEPKKAPKPIRVSSTKRIVKPQQKKGKLPVFKPSITAKAKKRAESVKLCPMCGAPLGTIITGAGANRRRNCARCGQNFAM